MRHPMTCSKPETMSFARDNEPTTSGNTTDAHFLAMMDSLNRLIAAGMSSEEMPQTFEELQMILQTNTLGAMFEDKEPLGCTGSTATPSEASLPDI